MGWDFAQTPVGELTALPRPPRWLRGWDPRGKGRRGKERGREGRESRNAQIQIWQAYGTKKRDFHQVRRKLLRRGEAQLRPMGVNVGVPWPDLVQRLPPPPGRDGSSR